MSKKRKRHQDPDETVILDDKSSPPPENGTLENKETISVPAVVLSDDVVVNVQRKIFHATKEMSRALRKARDFEVRKIVKRIKAAKFVFTCSFLTDRQANESDKILRLEKELQIAKVDHY